MQKVKFTQSPGRREIFMTKPSAEILSRRAVRFQILNLASLIERTSRNPIEKDEARIVAKLIRGKGKK